MQCLSNSVLIIAILLFTFSNALAQDNSKPLALKECIQIALDNSSRITIAKRDVVVAELGVKDVRAGYSPRLDATANYKVIEETDDHYDAKLFLTETFYDNGKTPARVKQAKASLASAQLDFQRIQNELTLEVISGYYALLKAQEMLKVKEEGLKQSQTHLALAMAMYDAGAAPKADVLKAEVGVGNSELDMIEAENKVSIAQTDLSNIMGIDLNSPFLILDTGLSEPLSMTIDECQDYALANRPEIKKAEISLIINEINLKLAKKDALPCITIKGSCNIEVDQIIDKHDWDKSTGWDLIIKTSLPIFDAGKSKRGVMKADINLANTRTNAEQLRKGIALEVKKAYLTARSQKKVIETAQKQVAQTQESFDVAQGRYKSGVAPMIEVIDTQATFNNARTNYVKAVYDYQIAIFALKKAIGGNIL